MQVFQLDCLFCHCAPLVAAGCIVSPIVATFATVGHNENMKKNNNKDRERRKIRAFELLASGETVSSVAEKTGFNKGSISDGEGAPPLRFGRVRRMPPKCCHPQRMNRLE